VQREYFVARNSQGQWAWIFRDAQGWFLHGLFA
jgi:protein ImuB